MKPSIPETGIVIALHGDMAKVMLKGGEACKGCGQAKMGLCKSADLNMIVEAKNIINARVGDIVVVGIHESTRLKGYLLAFVVPLISLFSGALAGMFLSRYLFIKGLDVFVGFGALIVALYFSLLRLNKLDRESSLVVKAIL